ncbi:hypothetical protein M0804_011750 [Polistes exclamans]|nr:hypothetical protein M0804_011750 [Polistes exclamans]
MKLRRCEIDNDSGHNRVNSQRKTVSWMRRESSILQALLNVIALPPVKSLPLSVGRVSVPGSETYAKRQKIDRDLA